MPRASVSQELYVEELSLFDVVSFSVVTAAFVLVQIALERNNIFGKAQRELRVILASVVRDANGVKLPRNAPFSRSEREAARRTLLHDRN